MEELIARDPVREEAFHAISYQEIYGKSAADIERRLDAEVDSREKARMQIRVPEAIRNKEIQRLKRAVEQNKEPAPAVNEAQGGVREPISLAALNLAAPKNRPAALHHAQNNQPQNNQPQNPENGHAGKRRNSFG